MKKTTYTYNGGRKSDAAERCVVSKLQSGVPKQDTAWFKRAKTRYYINPGERGGKKIDIKGGTGQEKLIYGVVWLTFFEGRVGFVAAFYRGEGCARAQTHLMRKYLCVTPFRSRSHVSCVTSRCAEVRSKMGLRGEQYGKIQQSGRQFLQVSLI